MFKVSLPAKIKVSKDFAVPLPGSKYDKTMKFFDFLTEENFYRWADTLDNDIPFRIEYTRIKEKQRYVILDRRSTYIGNLIEKESKHIKFYALAILRAYIYPKNEVSRTYLTLKYSNLLKSSS